MSKTGVVTREGPPPAAAVYKLWTSGASFWGCDWSSYWQAESPEALLDEALRQIAGGTADQCRITGPDGRVWHQWGTTTFLPPAEPGCRWPAACPACAAAFPAALGWRGYWGGFCLACGADVEPAEPEAPGCPHCGKPAGSGVAAPYCRDCYPFDAREAAVERRRTRSWPAS